MLFQFFDRDEEVLISQRCLPHWEQPGRTYFITFRTLDSIPESVLNRWRVERAGWLRRHAIDPQVRDWRQQVAMLALGARREFHEHFTNRWLEELDCCHGACVLRRPELSQIVAASLHHFDGDRYLLGDFVVMPNHVHVLVQFPSIGQLKAQGESWRTYTARQINQVLGQRGQFWQDEGFDHLVRSAEQFEFLRQYIAHNPRKAKLAADEFRHYRRPDDPSVV
jgi:REP element-mobilizing transposase RayT